jgi:hypothetical protein
MCLRATTARNWVELDRASTRTELGLWLVVNSGLRAHLALAENDPEGAESFGRQIEVAKTHGLEDLPHIGYVEAAYGAGVLPGRAEEARCLQIGHAQLGDFDPARRPRSLLHAPVRRRLDDPKGARELPTRRRCCWIASHPGDRRARGRWLARCRRRIDVAANA